VNLCVTHVSLRANRPLSVTMDRSHFMAEAAFCFIVCGNCNRSGKANQL
jgi:hypothetical protein